MSEALFKRRSKPVGCTQKKSDLMLMCIVYCKHTGCELERILRKI